MKAEMISSLWHLDADTSEIKQETVEKDRDGLTLTAHYSLISAGTELLVARGLVPPALHKDMRVPYMQGDFMFPVKYGYSLVGADEHGTLFHVMHPHQSTCVADPLHTHAISAGIPPKRATLASNIETALTAVWDGMVLPGERILVVGFGLIGSLVARIVSDIPGVELKVLETDPHRREFATNMGFLILENEQEAIEPFDKAFHCSASESGLQSSIDLVGREGRVVEMSWYGARKVTLDLGGDFHSKRKRILSSQVGVIPPYMGSRWSYKRRKDAVFRLLQNPVYDQHITHEISLVEAAELFNAWRTRKPEGLGYVIRYI